jgi:hypothetical protein
MKLKFLAYAVTHSFANLSFFPLRPLRQPS